MLSLRNATEADLGEIRRIYEYAQDYMIRSGNPTLLPRFAIPLLRIYRLHFSTHIPHIADYAPEFSPSQYQANATANDGNTTAMPRLSIARVVFPGRRCRHH